MKQTAMQKLIDWADQGLKHSQPTYRAAMSNLIQIIESELLEEEKKQIVDAYIAGMNNTDELNEKLHSENYFTQTYQ